MKKTKLSIQDLQKYEHLKLKKHKSIKGGRNHRFIGIVVKDDGFIGSTVDITGPPVQSPGIDIGGLAAESFANAALIKQ